MNQKDAKKPEEKFEELFEELQSGFEDVEGRLHELYGCSMALGRSASGLEVPVEMSTALFRAKEKILKGMQILCVPKMTSAT